MLVNINNIVKVRLNDFGKKIHNEKYFYPARVDEQGYTSYQLWSFAHVFGPYLVLGMDLPFEAEVEI